MPSSTKPDQKLYKPKRPQPLSTFRGTPTISTAAIPRLQPPRPISSQRKATSDNQSFGSFDLKLKAVLSPHCKFHHTHSTGAGVSALKQDPAYRSLLEHGLARVSKAIWIKAEQEELYPVYFNQYCANQPVPQRQKQLLYDFFSAWNRGVQSFMAEEVIRRDGGIAVKGLARTRHA